MNNGAILECYCTSSEAELRDSVITYAYIQKPFREFCRGLLYLCEQKLALKIFRRTHLASLNLMKLWYLSEWMTERYLSTATPTSSSTDSTVTYRANKYLKQRRRLR